MSFTNKFKVALHLNSAREEQDMVRSVSPQSTTYNWVVILIDRTLYWQFKKITTMAFVRLHSTG